MKTKTRKRRGSSRYYIYSLMVLLAIAGVGTGIYFILSNISLFNLKTIQISGNVSVADSLLNKTVKPYLGQNLLAISKRNISKDIMRYARVKSVKVQRRFLSTLRIQIQERKGCLYVKSLDGDLFPIDQDGVVLEKYGNIYSENLPIVSTLLVNSSLKTGKKLNNSTVRRVLAVHKQIMKEAPEFIPNISEYYAIDSTVYIVDARNGMRLIPSSDDIAKQFSRYEFVQDNGNIKRNAILDLRFAKQVVVKAGN